MKKTWDMQLSSNNNHVLSVAMQLFVGAPSISLRFESRSGQFHGIRSRASFMASEVRRVSCERSGEFHVRGQASFMSQVRRVSCQRSGEFHVRGQASFMASEVRRVSWRQRTGELTGSRSFLCRPYELSGGNQV